VRSDATANRCSVKTFVEGAAAPDGRRLHEFQGIDGKANYRGTPVESVLPVSCTAATAASGRRGDADDRRSDHPSWPVLRIGRGFIGYNDRCSADALQAEGGRPPMRPQSERNRAPAAADRAYRNEGSVDSGKSGSGGASIGCSEKRGQCARPAMTGMIRIDDRRITLGPLAACRRVRSGRTLSTGVPR